MSTPWDARIASLLVRPLVGSPVSPNHLTTLRLLTGMAGALILALGESKNPGAWLIFASNFIDHTDGELARMSGRTSRFGHLYDLTCDALVTIGMFVGIGFGLVHHIGPAAVVMGAVAGLAVAAIFHLRYVIEERAGKTATRQPRLAGFEAEDILYLFPLVTAAGVLPGFLQAAAIGAPLAAALVALQYRRVRRAGPP